MPKYRKERTILHLSIPMKFREEVDALLLDPKLNKVPYGAYSDFFVKLFRDAQRHAKLDLSQYGFEYSDVIYGSSETIAKLETLFTRAMRNKYETRTAQA